MTFQAETPNQLSLYETIHAMPIGERPKAALKEVMEMVEFSDLDYAEAVEVLTQALRLMKNERPGVWARKG